MGLYGSPEFEPYSPNDIKVKNHKPKKTSNKIYMLFKNVFAIIGVIATFIFIVTLFNTPPSEMPQGNNENNNGIMSAYQITKNEYIPMCAEYNYKDIARYPAEYKGKNAKFTGKVVQVLEDPNSNVINLRMDIAQDEYGYWSDTIYVLYERKSINEQRILVDDIITVYGQLSGLCTYTTVLGDTISIPEISIIYYDLIE